MAHHDRARRFVELHEHGTFVLPNAWDAASAAVIQRAGAAAIATTSSGISWSLGVPDGENLSRDDVVARVELIAGAVGVPVSADVEAGYGPSPADVAATIEAVIDAGAVGVNLEDGPGPDGHELWPVAEQCERIAAARAAADTHGTPFVINARTDVFLFSVGDPDQREAMVIERGEQFARAGADCLFVPGVTDAELIARIVAASPLPVNILLAPGRGPGIAELATLGVRRVSIGGTIARVAYRAAQLATEQVLAGDDEPLRGGLTHADMQALMGDRPE
jgi:2-methylisocitrate lyase-like PEP mutase family enzyme